MHARGAALGVRGRPGATGASGASGASGDVRYGERVFGRRPPRPRPDDASGNGSRNGSGSGIGIGALVRVVPSERGGDRWVGEPVGVVVAPGGNQLGGVQRTWVVAFDEPVHTEDGRGPFERATVLGRQLVPVEPAE